MPCNCIKETEERIIKMIADSKPEWIIHETTLNGFQNSSLIFTTPAQKLLTNPFEITYTVPSGRGKVTPKKYKTNIMPAFCQFCGIKIDIKGGDELG